MTARVYTTEEIMEMKPGTCVIEVGNSDMARQTNMIEGKAPKKDDLKLRVMDGRYAGQLRTIFPQDHRNWILSSELRKEDGENPLSALQGKEIKSKSKIYGEIFQGELACATPYHVVLKNCNNKQLEGSNECKTQGYTILGLDATDRDLWD